MFVSSGLSLGLGELTLRRLDGYELTRLRLVPRSVGRRSDNAPALAHLARLRVPEGVDRGWFEEDPPPLPDRPRDPELETLFAAVSDPARATEATRVWNREFVLDQIRSSGRGGGYFAGFPDVFFVFDPSERTPHPRFRYPRGVTTPGGVSTNRLCFRGPEIALDKPPGVVRIAFVGASTTLGGADAAFSYPEHVTHWLNAWLAHASRDLRVDGVNAGREGFTSSDIAAVVRQEILPLEPDLVVYYEGSNQFSFREFLLAPSGEPLRWDRPASAPGALESRFALARRLSLALGAFRRGDGREPEKPDYTLAWPSGLDEQEPDLSRTNDLPAGLRQALADLEAIRSALRSIDAELALCSFAWLVRDGMVLHPVRDARLFDYLNRDWWPYRYRDMARMADFQNRVFRRYAHLHDVPFLEVAERLPEDPALYSDAIHTRPAGTRLRAWVTFLELLPWLETRIRTGALPRLDRHRLERHPNEAARRPFPWGSMISRVQERRGRREAAQ